MCALDPLIVAAPMLPHVTTQIVEGIRTMSKALILAVAALGLTACETRYPKETTGSADAGAEVAAASQELIAATTQGGVYKVCDFAGGRAIYTYKNGYAGGIAVVDAMECRK